MSPVGLRILSGFLGLTGLALAGVMLNAGIGSATHAAELTFDITNYRYREEDNNNEFLMRDESKPPFVGLGIRDWDRPKTEGSYGFMYTGEVAGGRVSYHSRNSGTQKKKYYKARAEGYLAYRANEAITVFGGLGARFLHDDSGGHPTTNGGIGYDRENLLVYLPLGVQFDPIDNLTIKAQGNVLLRGWQISYLKDTDPRYQTAHNIQDKGWGIDLTADYRFSEKWSAYSFFRYWNIDRSDNESGDVTGVGFVRWWEPDNTTEELGMGVAYHF